MGSSKALLEFIKIIFKNFKWRNKNGKRKIPKNKTTR
jgi:hypothetical protein